MPKLVSIKNPLFDRSHHMKNKKSSYGVGLCTKAYILVWCICILIQFLDETVFGSGSGGLDVRPLGSTDYQVLLPLLIILLFSFFMSSQSTLLVPVACLAHAVDLGIRWERMPVVWDHEQWAMQVELSFLLVFGTRYLLGNRSSKQASPESVFLWISRTQFAICYAASTFWKLNTSFLNTSTSCGTVLILELFATYLPESLLPPPVVEVLGQAAPYMTIGVEGAIAFGMFGNYQAFTIVLAVLFHLSIFLMPVNSAGGFSMDCQSRFILFFCSTQVETYCREATLRTEIVLSCFGSLLLLVVRYFGTRAPLDFGFLGMCILSVVYFRMLQLGGRATKLHKTTSLTHSFFLGLTIGLTLLYGFGTLILGLQQMGAPGMYGNLRYYGQSNHYFTPIAVLPDSMIFGGGIVKVVFSTSTAVNRRLAYIPSEEVFPETALRSIRSATKTDSSIPIQFFPLCQSNPHSRQLLSDIYDPSNPPGSANFLPFYIPISEIRKALSEEDPAASFILNVVDAGKSRDLRIGEHDTMLVFDGPRRCVVKSIATGQVLRDCLDDNAGRLILQPGPETAIQQIAAKLLYPYPQFIDMEEEICMS